MPETGKKRKFSFYQDLSAKWQASISRFTASETKESKKEKEKSKPGRSKEFLKLPDTVCRKFNENKCDCKDDKHPSTEDPSKFLADKRAFCLKNHPYSKHK
jgi:hypothetical protein